MLQLKQPYFILSETIFKTFNHGRCLRVGLIIDERNRIAKFSRGSKFQSSPFAAENHTICTDSENPHFGTKSKYHHPVNHELRTRSVVDDI